MDGTKRDPRAPSPSCITSAPAAVLCGRRSWRVTMQNGYARFMYEGGPGDVIKYNLRIMMTRINEKLVKKLPFVTGFTDIVSDSYELTDAGNAALDAGNAALDVCGGKAGAKRGARASTGDAIVELRFAGHFAWCSARHRSSRRG